MDPLILEIRTRGLHRYEAIAQEVTTIGRALDNDIILSDPTVAAHHLKIIRYGDDSLEIVNLTDINPTRTDERLLTRFLSHGTPVPLEIGRLRAQLLRQDSEVAEVRPLSGKGKLNHLFQSGIWTTLLLLICLAYGALSFYLDSYTEFDWTDLIKSVLRDTVVTLGSFIIALSVLERLLVNRWDIRQLVTAVCLVYLIYHFIGIASHSLGYFFSATWPLTLALFCWNFLILPGSIALYLIHISHLKQRQSLLLATLIAAPVVVPSLLQHGHLKAMLDDFSNSARYNNSLSAVNWHLSPSVSIDDFVKEAGKLDQGKYAN
ncbi:MAG: FHA domain-containing protein [Pseudomonadota bacterium]